MPRAPQAFKNHPMSFAKAQDAGGFRAVCQHIVDGDTIDCLIDAGFHHYPYEAIRVANVDTPEIFRPKSEAEYELGLEAKSFVEALLFEKPVFLTVTGHSFNRYVAEVWYWAGDGNDYLLSSAIVTAKLTKADVPKEDE